MTKIKLWRKWIAENSSSAYKVFLIAFFCLMMFFLSSKLWMPNDAKIQNSDIGTQEDTDLGTTLVLKSWLYNPSKNFMEATFAYKNTDDIQKINFVPIAHADTNKVKALNVSVPYNNNGLLVIQFTNVPQEWNVISLWINEQDEEAETLTQNDLDASDDFSMSSEDGSSDPDLTGSGANFLCDIRKVTVNHSLKSQSKLYYSLQSIDNEIAGEKKKITKLQDEIAAAKLNISQLTEDIASLKANRKYQTPDEVSEANSAIQSKTQQIEDLKSSIVSCQEKIKNYQQKVALDQKKWNDTKSGHFIELDAASSKPESDSSSYPPASKPESRSASSETPSIPVMVD